MLHSVSITAPVLAGSLNNKKINSIEPGPGSLKDRAMLPKPQGHPLSKKAAISKDGGDKQSLPALTKRLKPENVLGISGPSQPEMNSFKSVGVDNMVNLFTGDFSYNIPLLDVDGYPINIFYNAGITMDQEASWVGLGWNLNPGAINRQMRGLPDDFDGSNEADVITKENHIKPNITVGLDVGFRNEFIGFGKPKNEESSVLGNSFQFTPQIMYNNYTGFGWEVSGSLQRKRANTIQDQHTCNYNTSTEDVPGFGLNLALSSKSGVTVKPTYSMGLDKANTFSRKGSFATSVSYNSRAGIEDFQLDFQNRKAERAKEGQQQKYSGMTAGFAHNFAHAAYTPSMQMPITYQTFNLEVQFGNESPVGKLKAASIGGYYARSFVSKKDEVLVKPAFGYLNLQHATTDDALLDFNRMNDGPYIAGKTKAIAIPQYTYDVFEISGEGTGGSFRAYRGDIGYVRDPFVRSKSIKGSLGVDLGLGTGSYNIGVNVDGSFGKTTVGKWSGNDLVTDKIKFRNPNGNEEPVYFRNPGEMSATSKNYYDKIGGEKLVRLELEKEGMLNFLPFVTENLLTYKEGDLEAEVDAQPQPDPAAARLPLSTSIASKVATRDKRSQVISYLTAEEASRVGLDKTIKSYNIFNAANPFPCTGAFTEFSRYGSILDNSKNYRQPNHISEIDVLEQDGKRYVYGLPVYNKIQKEVTIGVENQPTQAGSELVAYEIDPTTGKPKPAGKDEYYSSEMIPAYAHSFLLTALLSADYSDLTGDGITGDDIGTAVKFNYKRIGADNADLYKWRTPAEPGTQLASYNAGLKTDNSDNKAYYTYGEKELWYTHSIESKTMVAVFITSKRDDGLPVSGEHGGIDATGSVRLQKLDKILLYSKADLVSRKDAAKPIKTVHFTYDYTLCKNVSNSAPDVNGIRKGKLTLKSIYFTYNGSDISKKHKYVFRYNEGYNQKSFDYDRTMHDSWGNLKTDYHQTNYDDNGVPVSVNSNTLNSLNPKYNGQTKVMKNVDFPFPAQVSVQKNTASYRSEKEAIDAFAGAWNLSQIDLPSGATISVDYEADSYAYVQNRKACQMMSLAGFGSSSNTSSHPITNKLYNKPLELDGMQFPYTDYGFVFFDVPEFASQEALRDPGAGQNEVNRRYLNGINQLLLKLYVKVPHDIYSESTDGYEPITVYAKMSGRPGMYNCGYVPINNNGSMTSKRIWIELQKDGVKENRGIVEAVFQYLREKLPSKAYYGSDVQQDGAAAQVIKSLVGMIASIGNLLGESDAFKKLGYCRNVDVDRSFGRLSNPVGEKFGGGHRVKKIEISDNWELLTTRINNGAGKAPLKEHSSSYGQVYEYTTTDADHQTISSGVASYEPSSAGEENPFRELLQFDTRQFMGPASFGSMELPIAEGFYPAAMVGYAKVRVHSLSHESTGLVTKTEKGPRSIQETEFYTTRDFPTLSDYTKLIKNNNQFKFNPNAINTFLKFYSLDYNTVSQGFRVQLNNMNGKLKQQSTYAESKPDEAVQFTKYIYRTTLDDNSGESQKDPGKLYNKVAAVTDASGVVDDNTTIGKDIELMVDFREHKATSYSGQLKFNLESQVPYIYIPSFYLPASFDQRIFRSVSVMKVINTYGILERMEVYNNGSKVNTDNLVYDSETGNPLITSTINTFNKPMYSFSYPAYWAYDGMGLAYKNIGVQFDHVFVRNGFIETVIDESLLQSGDELYVFDYNTDKKMPGNFKCEGFPPDLDKNFSNKVWVLDLSKDPRYHDVDNKRRIILLDREGVPYNGSDVYLKVIRSGRRNMLSASIGKVTSLADLVTNKKIVIPVSGLLNTGALTFKEKWRGEDAFYTVNEPAVSYTSYPLYKGSLPISRIKNVMYYNKRTPSLFHPKRDDVGWWESGDVNDYFGARHWSNSDEQSYSETNLSGAVKHQFRSSRSWIDFQFNAHVPENAVIFSAKLNLISHKSKINEYGDGFIHDALKPHQNGVGTTATTNELQVEPMTTRWEAVGTDTWQKRFFEVHRPPARGPLSPVIPKTGQSSAVSYIPGSTADAIDVTTLVNQWQTNRSNSVATGFRIRPTLLSNVDSKYEIRQCFSSSSFLDISYFCPTGNCTGTNTGLYVSVPTTTISKVCKSIYYKTAYINPYVLGMLGNWRSFKTYAFFDDRKEELIDAAHKPAPAQDGTLRSFVPFWRYNTTAKLLTAANDEVNTTEPKWVWSSGLSQVNRRGLEIENHDPLGRFNAGLYGYNETLPVAVINNGHYSESAFEGFEDYDGFTDEFCPTCKPKRHLDFGSISMPNANGPFVDKSQSHSGKYSLRIGAGQTQLLNIPVKTYNPEDPELNVTVSHSQYAGGEMNGTGLKGTYTAGSVIKVIHSDYPTMDITGGYKGGFCTCQKTHADIKGNIPVDPDEFTVNWHGYLRVERSSSNYEIKLDVHGEQEDGSNSTCDVTITNKSNNSNILNMTLTKEDFSKSYPNLNLVAGTDYEVNINFKKDPGKAFFRMYWKLPQQSDFIPIETKYLYETPHTVIAPVNVICKSDAIGMKASNTTTQDLGNVLIDRFTPQPATKMLFSAWVREGIVDCNCKTYNHNAISFVYKNSQGQILNTQQQPLTFASTGPIIEGWQRYEIVLDIPVGARSIEGELQNKFADGQTLVFFDDIRMHPFNANMKSFVYDPVSLKLKAELDENNYASFYEYDDEGTLVRVKKETVQGIKTIQETRSALRQVDPAAVFVEPVCPAVNLSSSTHTVSYSFNPVSSEVDSYVVSLYNGNTLVKSYQHTGSSAMSGSFTGLYTNTLYKVSVKMQIASIGYTKECNQTITTPADANAINGGQSVSPGLSSTSGTLHIVSPVTLKLTANGGWSSGAGTSSSITINIIGLGVYTAYAEANQTSDRIITLPAGDYSYTLSGAFVGSSGNTGFISFQ